MANFKQIQQSHSIQATQRESTWLESSIKEIYTVFQVKQIKKEHNTKLYPKISQNKPSKNGCIRDLKHLNYTNLFFTCNQKLPIGDLG